MLIKMPDGNYLDHSLIMEITAKDSKPLPPGAPTPPGYPRGPRVEIRFHRNADTNAILWEYKMDSIESAHEQVLRIKSVVNSVYAATLNAELDGNDV